MTGLRRPKASEEVARLMTQAEDNLRRLGFAEGTIKLRRPAIRAVIEAHLNPKDTQ